MRQGLVFLIQQLVLATVFYIILVSSASFNFGNPQKKDIEIMIGHGDTAKGELMLSSGGSSGDSFQAYSGKKVTWLIYATTSNVDSFWIDEKDTSASTQIFYFFDHPPSRHVRSGSGRVDIFRRHAEYIYAIHWKDSLGNPHTYDPKIAIMPSTNFTEPIVYIAYGLIALILSLRFFSKRTKK